MAGKSVSRPKLDLPHGSSKKRLRGGQRNVRTDDAVRGTESGRSAAFLRCCTPPLPEALMILPNVRASFGRTEANLVIGLLTRGDSDERSRQEERLREEGFDAILDDPRTLNALLAGWSISTAPAPLVFNRVLVRHVLLESQLSDRAVADYVASLLVQFGRGRRAFRVQEVDGVEHEYLTDLLAEVDHGDERRAFLTRAHLGDYALWQSGLFPARITGRERRGAPELLLRADGRQAIGWPRAAV